MRQTFKGMDVNEFEWLNVDPKVAGGVDPKDACSLLADVAAVVRQVASVSTRFLTV
jgi:thymidine phosphorylase